MFLSSGNHVIQIRRKIKYQVITKLQYWGNKICIYIYISVNLLSEGISII